MILSGQGLQDRANVACQDQAGHSPGKVQHSPAEVFHPLGSESLQTAGPLERDSLLDHRLRLAVISCSSQSPAPAGRRVLVSCPSGALGCVWEGRGGQTAASTTWKGPPCLTPTPSPSPYRSNSLPSFGPNAAGPACNDAVHVEVVGVIPSTVFCTDLENDNRLQSDSHSFAGCLGKVETAPREEASPTDTGLQGLPLTAARH